MRLSACWKWSLILLAFAAARTASPKAGVSVDSAAIAQTIKADVARILIKRLSGPGEAGYWDQEKDMVVGPDDITLAFVDFFDFYDVPIKDFRYYLCKILSFPRHADYEGREALLEVIKCKVFHDESADKKQGTA